MLNFQSIIRTIATGASRGGLMASKYAPEILTGAGVVGVVGTVVLASRATLKLSPILEEMGSNLDKVTYAKDNVPQYDQITETRDITIIYTRTVVDVFKAYMPAIALGVASIACLVGSTKILRGRNVALAAAYKALDDSFRRYRSRVREELGEDADRHYKMGYSLARKEVVDSEGRAKEVEVREYVSNPTFSEYAKWFNSDSAQWTGHWAADSNLLRMTQSHMNDKLRTRGHVFLNEVYDALDLPRTQAGSVVGWVWQNERGGDNFIDFGLYDQENRPAQDFINGQRMDVLLDFNVDGLIYDLI